MSRAATSAVATIDQFINSVGAGSVKTAGEKVADGSKPMSEPGSIGGETKHPVKNVDDRLQEVPEGERSKENTKDVKEDQGAPSVENAPEASTKNAASVFNVVGRFAKKAEGAVSTPGSAADDHISTTTKVAPTGEDPAHETNSAKAGKEDKRQGGRGGTEHPASTENDQLDGHKYAADTPLEKLSGDMRGVGNNLLAAIHHIYVAGGVQPPAATKQAATKQAAAPAVGTVDPQLAYYLGSEMAGILSGTFDKQAADAMVHGALTGVIKQASEDADMFINYANGYRAKQAEGDDEGGDAAGASSPSPAQADGGGSTGGGGGPPGGGEEAMMASLGAGGGGGPPGGGGGDPTGGMGGGGGEQEAQMLAQLLEQLGVTPEELEAAMHATAGGGAPPGGGMPGGGGDPTGGMTGGAGGGAPGGMETQAAAGGGKVASTVKQAEVAAYIKELFGRSRAGRK